MTNYIKDLTSEIKCFRDNAERIAEKLRTEATVTDSIIRWNSNGQVPPADCVELAAHIGLPVCVDQCKGARDYETEQFLAGYRKRMENYQHSEEELFEMRAAFGPGAEVVNIVTGRVTKL